MQLSADHPGGGGPAEAVDKSRRIPEMPRCASSVWGLEGCSRQGGTSTHVGGTLHSSIWIQAAAFSLGIMEGTPGCQPAVETGWFSIIHTMRFNPHQKQAGIPKLHQLQSKMVLILSRSSVSAGMKGAYLPISEHDD